MARGSVGEESAGVLWMVDVCRVGSLVTDHSFGRLGCLRLERPIEYALSRLLAELSTHSSRSSGTRLTCTSIFALARLARLAPSTQVSLVPAVRLGSVLPFLSKLNSAVGQRATC